MLIEHLNNSSNMCPLQNAIMLPTSTSFTVQSMYLSSDLRPSVLGQVKDFCSQASYHNHLIMWRLQGDHTYHHGRVLALKRQETLPHPGHGVVDKEQWFAQPRCTHLIGEAYEAIKGGHMEAHIGWSNGYIPPLVVGWIEAPKHPAVLAICELLTK